jgi:hypothetical protein
MIFVRGNRVRRIVFALGVCGFLHAAAAGGASAASPDQADCPVQLSFKLPQLKGNPFDFTINDVEVTFASAGHADATVPAFFDGDSVWKARFTPETAGHVALKSITLNGGDAKPADVSATEFDCAKTIAGEFVRIDPADKMRFAFEDGSPFYPVGYNLAWRSVAPIDMPPLVDSLNRMGRAGVNWTRIWMNCWDGKNLDWPEHETDHIEPGTILLPVARGWDAIVEAAQKNHIFFQMVLQHHGQYSSNTDTNWSINPWNKANGGWLETPSQFFTDARAIQLTKNKYRYILARWGYSPAIMAFELCNEVESTDCFKSDLPAVAAWHETMAKFIRSQDHYHHLITTSSNTLAKSIWTATDYYQAHAYPSDLISAIGGLDEQKLDRAYFYGEMGGSSSGPPVTPHDTLHQILWASLMSGSAGTGEYWDWFEVEPRNLLNQFTSVQEFVHQSNMLNDRHLRPRTLAVETAVRGPLSFGPGRDWAKSESTDFTVNTDGTVEHLGGMSAFLQGRGNNHAMFPYADFHLEYAKAGTFAVEIDQTNAAGARVEMTVDGKPATAATIGKIDRPARRLHGDAGNDQTNHLDLTLEVPIPSGAHTLRLQNTGDDWAHLRRFTLDPYSPQLAVLAKTSENEAILWAYQRLPENESQPVVGKITIASLDAGAYRVVWWNTENGTIVQESRATVSGSEPLMVETPPVTRDIACWIVPADSH